MATVSSEVTPMLPTFRAPETMTAAEQSALLRATADAPRDYIYSMALGTGLHLRELLGLNVGDVSPDGREVRRRVTLDPATTKGGRFERGSAEIAGGSRSKVP
jgi:integrase